MEINKSITIIIVIFYPNKKILNDCIRQLSKYYKIIIINNGKNVCSNFFNQDITTENINIANNKNKGNGEAINVGAKYTKTKYILYLDVDTKIINEDIIKLYKIAENYQDLALIAPSISNIKYSKSDVVKVDKKNNLNEMRFVEGAIMLINKLNTFDKGIEFDENIFLYYEENDFYYQCIKNKLKILLALTVIAQHISNSSIDLKIIDKDEIELNRNWHLMWSKFYYFKKNYSYSYAVLKTFKSLFSSIIKLSIYYLFNKKKSQIYISRFSGLLNSYLLKKSWRRPNVS